MSGRRPRMIQRNRSQLELQVLHVEISKESHDFLKKLAGAKQMPMGGVLDVMLKRRRDKLYTNKAISL